MTETEQDKLVAEANVVGIAMQKLTGQLREVEAANETLQDALRSADAEITRKDAVIGNLTAQLDDAVRDLRVHREALSGIFGHAREALAQKLLPEHKPQRLNGAPQRPQQVDPPMPRVVTRGPAAIAG